MTAAQTRETEPLLLELPERIETGRLLLRAPRAGDGPALHAALVDSLAELRRYLASLPWVAQEQTPASAETWCRNSQANFLARRDLHFLLFEKASGLVVGATGLHHVEWATPKAEVGYWCRTTHAGRGLMGEAVAALAEYGFRHLGVVRLAIVTDEENAASRRVAERAGFVLEGIQRHERRAPDGTLRNTCLYARLAPEVARP